MKPVLLSVALFGNVPPPSYKVILPQGREWVYEGAAWLFLVLTVVAGGLWYARGRSLPPVSRRALLWSAAVCLATTYSAWWVWIHRDAETIPHSLVASVAVEMHGVWLLGSATVILLGWRIVRGGEPARGPLAFVDRALAFAIVTLIAGVVIGLLGFRLAFIVLLPGFWLEGGSRTETEAALALVGVSVCAWWLAWAIILGLHRMLQASVEPAEFRTPNDSRSETSENPTDSIL